MGKRTGKKDKAQRLPNAPPRSLPTAAASESDSGALTALTATDPITVTTQTRTSSADAGPRARAEATDLEPPPSLTTQVINVNSEGTRSSSDLLPQPTTKRPHEDLEHANRRQVRKLEKAITLMENDRNCEKNLDKLSTQHMQARLIGRMVHPFMRPYEALSFGIHFDGDFDDLAPLELEDDDPDFEVKKLSEVEKAEKRELLFEFYAMQDILEVLKGAVEYLEDDALMILGDYIKSRMNYARGDDSSALRKEVIIYMQFAYGHEHERYKSGPAMIHKAHRGWHTWHTARLLCPQSLLATFDACAEWESFADSVLRDERLIAADDYPMFLYDQQMISENCLDGLLRSKYFLMCYKRVWTGPESVYLAHGRNHKTPGKPPLAIKYGIKSVTPRSLAYTAVLVRCELTAHQNWSVSDVGGFDAAEFYDALIDLFAEDANPVWVKETLAWWDEKVFGNLSSAAATPRATSGHQTSGQKIQAQRRAERKATRAAGGYAVVAPASTSTSTAPAGCQ
ncbi:hypothetical protein FKP32DRAFT_1763064 [Trametes sanguinea]|nr:hypothetical protein FKP32DRAFT_1763064 [Trametes sanguinea]